MTIRKLAVAWGLCAWLPLAHAQNFPERPVRIVVPYVPGGSTDLLSRLLAESVGESIGQTVIVENRPGAGGMLGTALVAKAPPDGHTIVICTIGTCAVNPTLFKNPGYDLFKDFAPVVFLGGVMNVFVVNNSVPVKNIKELIALARAQPGKPVVAEGVGEHDEVVHGAEVVARHGGGDIAVGARAVGGGNGGKGSIQPGVGPAGADLGLADGGEVLVHAALVRGSHLLFQLANFREVGVEDAAPAA